MKRDIRSLGKWAILLIALGLSLDIAGAAGWDISPEVAACYVQQTTNANGTDVQSYAVAGLGGMLFFHEPKTGALGYGIGFDLAGLPDDVQTTPRIAPGVSFHFGTKAFQGFGGVLLDPQDANRAVFMFGASGAF
jgi:hypothetical protein